MTLEIFADDGQCWQIVMITHVFTACWLGYDNWNTGASASNCEMRFAKTSSSELGQDESPLNFFYIEENLLDDATRTLLTLSIRYITPDFISESSSLG